MKKLLLPILVLGAMVAVQAEPIYTQSFDYGSSTLDFGDDLSGSGWSDNTGVIDYVPTAGLTYPGFNSSVGGALVYNFPSAALRSAAQDISYDFEADPDGQVYWLFALGAVNTALTTGGFTEMNLDGLVGSPDVNSIKFVMTDTGFYGEAFSTGSAVTQVNGGTYTLGETIGFLAKVTKGTGASPENTVVDFWFNPDLANLGVANGSITDSKFARDGSAAALDQVKFGGDTGGSYTWDEVRFTTDFNNIHVIPEPSSLLLTAMGLLVGITVMRRRN